MQNVARALLLAALLTTTGAAPARAGITISDRPTSDMEGLQGSTWSPRAGAATSNVNTGDLARGLADRSIVVRSAGSADPRLTVQSALSASTARNDLLLDGGAGPVRFEAPVQLGGALSARDVVQWATGVSIVTGGSQDFSGTIDPDDRARVDLRSTSAEVRVSGGSSGPVVEAATFDVAAPGPTTLIGDWLGRNDVATDAAGTTVLDAAKLRGGRFADPVELLRDTFVSGAEFNAGVAGRGSLTGTGATFGGSTPTGSPPASIRTAGTSFFSLRGGASLRVSAFDAPKGTILLDGGPPVTLEAGSATIGEVRQPGFGQPPVEVTLRSAGAVEVGFAAGPLLTDAAGTTSIAGGRSLTLRDLLVAAGRQSTLSDTVVETAWRVDGTLELATGRLTGNAAGTGRLVLGRVDVATDGLFAGEVRVGRPARPEQDDALPGPTRISSALEVPFVLDAGTLTGTGLTGALSAAATGGRILPGPGVLRTGALTLRPEVTVQVEAGRDRLAVTGPTDLAGATLVVQGSARPPVVLLDNDGADAVRGAFAGLPEGAEVRSAGRAYRISYRGGNGNDVVLLEPPAAPGDGAVVEEPPASPPPPPPPADPPAAPAPATVATAPPAPPASTPTPVSEDLRSCADRRVVLSGVFRASRGRVRLSGFVAAALAGQPVRLRSTDGRRTTVRSTAGGLFSASLPALRGPRGGAVRYAASVGTERSRALKLDRQLQILSSRTRRADVLLRARILGRVPPGTRVTVRRDTSCRSRETVATLRPGRSGLITVRLPRLDRREGVASYRLRAVTPGGGLRTFTLPILVEPR